MMNFTFCNPVKILFGPGQIKAAGEEASRLGRRCLIVTGKGSAKKTGLLDYVLELLGKEGIGIAEFSGIDPNPRIHHVVEGAEICRKEKLEFIAAIGGGSVMDCAKAISAAVYYPRNPWEMVLSCNGGKHAPPSKAMPTMMIPTLAATGSEMNAGSVITNPETTQKLFFIADCLYPRVTIADPELTVSVPPDQTAYGIADIITHVTECYFTDPSHNPIQDRWVESVIQAMLEFGKRAVDNGADMEARTHIQWASIVALNGWIQAGMRKRFPVHTIEHAVSAFYDIPHGAGLSILNPAWMKFSMKEIRKKLCLMGSRIFNIRESETSSEENAFKALAAFRNYLETIGAPLNLSRFGIGRDKFNEIAGDIVGTSGDRGGKIPGRPDLSKEDIISILEESL